MTKGTYQLLIWLRRRTDIRVGRLGEFSFPRGYYVYTGSAMGGLEARITRHLAKSKKFHWHIDYLLEHSRVIMYASIESSTRLECEANAATLAMEGAGVPAAGFGSSDCKCASHLVHFKKRPKLPLMNQSL